MEMLEGLKNPAEDHVDGSWRSGSQIQAFVSKESEMSLVCLFAKLFI